jgi:hypothetical protein
MKHTLTTACLLTAALAPATVHAYIDPGTGSVVTTAILGFFAAIGFTLRRYYYRIKDVFTGENRAAKESADPSTRES